MDQQKQNDSICQCVECGNVKPWREVSNGILTIHCPKCGGAMTIVSFINKSDGHFVDALSEYYSY